MYYTILIFMLITQLAGAVGFAVDRVCEMTGATHRKIDINLPVTDPKQVRFMTCNVM